MSENMTSQQANDPVLMIAETQDGTPGAPPPTSKDEEEKGFLGMPPELRNHVYRNLLLNPVPHRGVHPNILQSSRQIWKEAKDMLTDNVIHIDLSIDEEWKPTIATFKAHIHTNELLTSYWIADRMRVINTPIIDLPDGNICWPLFIASLRKLCIRITIHAPDAIHEIDDWGYEHYPMWHLSHTLCSLASFFENQGHVLDELSLEFDVKPALLEEIDGPRDIDGSGYIRWTAQNEEYGLTVLQVVLWQVGRIGRLDEKALKISGLSPNNEAFVRARIMSMPSNRRLDNIEDTTTSSPHELAQNPPSSTIASPRMQSPQPEQRRFEYTSELEERERISTLITALPIFPDLIDNLRVLCDEVEARKFILPEVRLSGWEGRLEETSHTWPSGTRKTADETEYYDPVKYAYCHLFFHVNIKAIGPGHERAISWWCDRLRERLDDFHAQLFDGRLPFVQRMLEKEAFQTYFKARERRLWEHRRLLERQRFRSSGGLEGLPAGLFSPDKSPWDGDTLDVVKWGSTDGRHHLRKDAGMLWNAVGSLQAMFDRVFGEW